MKNFETGQIRNIAVLGHGSSGKTTLIEAFMYQTGVIGRMGRVDAGNTLSDHDVDEVHRQISITTSLLPVQYKNCKVNVLDVPGYADFISEAVSVLAVADAGLLLIDGVNGVEVQTERFWRMLNERALPRVLFINKLDKENSNFDDILATIQKRFGKKCFAVQIPIGAESSFKGVIDLIHMKAIIEKDDNSMPTVTDIPAELQSKAESMRDAIAEAAAEADDELMMKYLDEGTLSDDEIINGLKVVIKNGNAYPILCGSAFKNYGTTSLLDMIIDSLPSPNEMPAKIGLKGEEEIELTNSNSGPLVAYAFKATADQFAGKITFLRIYSGQLRSGSDLVNVTRESKERIGNLFVLIGKTQDIIEVANAGDIVQVAKLHDTMAGNTISTSGSRIQIAMPDYPEPMLNFAISPKTKGEEDKLAQGMHRLMEEDSTLKFEIDQETHDAVISGMGELQVEIARDRLKRKFNVETILGNPHVAYRETITGNAEGHGRHKKQSGGAGQFGDVKLKLEPNVRGGGIEFIDAVVGGVVPRQFIPSTEKGVRDALKRGPIAGYPVVDVKVTLFDGQYHPVDSKDIAFQTAGRLGVQEGMAKARPIILEPIVHAEIAVPDEYIGDIIGGLSSKRGRVQGSDSLGGGMSVVKGQVPQAEMFQYSNELRALTKGQGSFTMSISHYEEVPSHVADQIAAEAKKRDEEER
ncbi:MAG: elongation factor G [bacterium]